MLCRYRSQQLLVALALDAGDVPRTPALGCTLFTHPAAVLLRAYLDLVRAPDELPGPALAGLLNRPNRYVNAATAEAVATAARPWAHLRSIAAREPSSGSRPLSALVELVEALRPGMAAALAPGAVPARPGRDLIPGAGPDLALGARPDVVPGTDPAVPLTSDDCVWTVVETFALDDLWAAEADAAAAGDGAGSDGAGPLEVFDSLLLLAQTYPDPATYLRTWDRLLADEQAHLGVADDTLSREESEDDLVVIGTIHAAKGREYDSIVIPDYDCDVSRWSAAEVEEERRVVYVGVTRARDAALFTVDSSSGFVHPFLRELVEQPEPGEHDALSAWLAEEPADELRERIADRLAEIEVLFPELVPEEAPAPAGGSASPESRPPRRALTAAAQRSQSRMDGSGGATKCFAVGSVPGRRYCVTSCCSSRSVTVRRWCWRRCSSQLGSTNVSMNRYGLSASRYTDQSVAPVRRRTRPTRRRARRKSSSASSRIS